MSRGLGVRAHVTLHIAWHYEAFAGACSTDPKTTRERPESKYDSNLAPRALRFILNRNSDAMNPEANCHGLAGASRGANRETG